MSQDTPPAVIEFENGVERGPIRISALIEKAMRDDEAAVFHAETGKRLDTEA